MEINPRDFLTNRLLRHVHDGVAVGERGSAGRTNHRVLQVAANVAETHSVGGAFFEFHRPLLNRPVDLAKVIDTGVLLRRSTCSNEVRDRDCSEQPDNGHHDHYFYQRETALAECFLFHTLVTGPFFYGVNTATSG